MRHEKQIHMQALDDLVYILAILIGITASAVSSFVIIPIITAITTKIVYFFVAVIGLTMGLLFELGVRDIESLEKKHHVGILFIIPAFTILNFLFLIGSSRSFPSIFGIHMVHDPLLIAFIYNVAFLLPYLFYQFFWKK